MQYTAISEDEGSTIKTVLKKQLFMSSRLIKNLKYHGQILKNGVSCYVTEPVHEGDILCLRFYEEANPTIRPVCLLFEMVYETEHFCVVNKPKNMTTHPSAGHYDDTLANALSYYWQERGENHVIRPINRLDKNTTGLMTPYGCSTKDLWKRTIQSTGTYLDEESYSDDYNLASNYKHAFYFYYPYFQEPVDYNKLGTLNVGDGQTASNAQYTFDKPVTGKMYHVNFDFKATNPDKAKDYIVYQSMNGNDPTDISVKLTGSKLYITATTADEYREVQKFTMKDATWYNFYIEIGVDGTIKVLIDGDLVKVLSTTFGTRDNVTGFSLGGDGIGKGEYDNIRLSEEYTPFADLRFVTHQELSDPTDPKSDLKDVATALDSHWTTTGVAATNTNDGPLKPPQHNFYWTCIEADIQVRLQNLAITYSMTTDAAQAQPYFDKCRELMLAMAHWTYWTDPEQGEKASLDLGYVTQGMSYAYDLLYNKLSDDDRKVISKAIKEKGVDVLYSAATDPNEYGYYDGKDLPPNTMVDVAITVGTNVFVTYATVTCGDKSYTAYATKDSATKYQQDFSVSFQEGTDNAKWRGPFQLSGKTVLGSNYEQRISMQATAGKENHNILTLLYPSGDAMIPDTLTLSDGDDNGVVVSRNGKTDDNGALDGTLDVVLFHKDSTTPVVLANAIAATKLGAVSTPTNYVTKVVMQYTATKDGALYQNGNKIGDLVGDGTTHVDAFTLNYDGNRTSTLTASDGVSVMKVWNAPTEKMTDIKTNTDVTVANPDSYYDLKISYANATADAVVKQNGVVIGHLEEGASGYKTIALQKPYAESMVNGRRIGKVNITVENATVNGIKMVENNDRQIIGRTLNVGGDNDTEFGDYNAPGISVRNKADDYTGNTEPMNKIWSAKDTDKTDSSLIRTASAGAQMFVTSMVNGRRIGKFNVTVENATVNGIKMVENNDRQIIGRTLKVGGDNDTEFGDFNAPGISVRNKADDYTGDTEPMSKLWSAKDTDEADNSPIRTTSTGAQMFVTSMNTRNAYRVYYKYKTTPVVTQDANGKDVTTYPDVPVYQYSSKNEKTLLGTLPGSAGWQVVSFPLRNYPYSVDAIDSVSGISYLTHKLLELGGSVEMTNAWIELAMTDSQIDYNDITLDTYNNFSKHNVGIVCESGFGEVNSGVRTSSADSKLYANIDDTTKDYYVDIKYTSTVEGKLTQTTSNGVEKEIGTLPVSGVDKTVRIKLDNDYFDSKTDTRNTNIALTLTKTADISDMWIETGVNTSAQVEKAPYVTVWGDAVVTTPTTGGSDVTTTPTTPSTGGGGSTGGTDPVDTTKTTVAPAVTAANNKTTAQVAASDMTTAITAATESKADIVIAPIVTGAAATQTVEIPTASIATAAGKIASNLVVKTGDATVTIPNSALKALGSLMGKTTTITTAKQDDGSIKVSVTVGGKDVEVAGLTAAIVAKSATAGTVAVLVGADGTESIIKNSVVADGSVIAKIAEGSTIKVEDKTKSFTDIDSHWGKDYINFATSRELFAGLTDTTFGPDVKMTRGMVGVPIKRPNNF